VYRDRASVGHTDGGTKALVGRRSPIEKQTRLILLARFSKRPK